MNRSILDEVIYDGKTIYIVTKVFDYYEKLKAEHLEQCVIQGIQLAATKKGVKFDVSSIQTFVPYRDTEQSMMVEDNQTKNIFKEDIYRLDNTCLLVGFLDGLSKDEGICFEIGYAYGMGIPSLAILTDFFFREIKPKKLGEHLADPVIDRMLAKVIRRYKISNSGESFFNRLNNSISDLYSQIAIEFENLFLTSMQPATDYLVDEENIDFYIDFGGGRFEWQRKLQNDLLQRFKSRGYKVAISRRFEEIYNERLVLNDAVEKDIINAARAHTVILTSDSIEMDPGTAAIQGFCRAKNKTIVLYDSSLTNIVGDNGYRSSRNLMIDNSASQIVQNFEDLYLLI